MKRGVVAWLAVIVPVWSVLVFCTYWEPVMRDGWGHFAWHENNDLSLRGLWEYARANYDHNNPRLGQIATLVLHTPGALHPTLTPLVELALFYLLALFALGRAPSLRRTDDALLFAVIVAMAFVCVRSLGPMLFYRPFTGNYVFSLVVNLAWLAPFRLHAHEARRWRPWLWSPLMLALGVASGMCNEHTGPALLCAALFALAVFWRRGERVVPWAWCGIAGMATGMALLYLAPGQDIRYLGLATQMSIVERVLDRGVIGNGRIVLLYVAYCTPLAAWLLPAALARPSGPTEASCPSTSQPRSLSFAQLAMVVVAVLIIATLLASPKHGDRLYFASLCLTCTAAAGWVVGRVARPGAARERVVVAVISALAIFYVGVRLVLAYHIVGTEFEARLAALRTAAPGAPVTLPAYSQTRSHYVLGDDFEAPHVRKNVGALYGLGPIELVPPANQP